MNKETIKEDLNTNTSKIRTALQAIEDTVFTTKLNDTEWSILECMEHIIIVEAAIVGIFHGPKETVERDPIRKIPIIKERFTDFVSKYPAPDMISPKGQYKTKETTLAAFIKGRDQLQAIGLASDWNEKCMGFKHFGFGYLTQIEWIYFCIFHAGRHLYQMEKMQQKIITR